MQAASFLHKPQSHQNTLLRVVYTSACHRQLFISRLELWRLFSVFFMDNFHGKHVDNMQSARERTGSVSDSCQRVEGDPPGLEEHVHVLLLA